MFKFFFAKNNKKSKTASQESVRGSKTHTQKQKGSVTKAADTPLMQLCKNPKGSPEDLHLQLLKMLKDPIIVDTINDRDSKTNQTALEYVFQAYRKDYTRTYGEPRNLLEICELFAKNGQTMNANLAQSIFDCYDFDVIALFEENYNLEQHGIFRSFTKPRQGGRWYYTITENNETR